MDGIQIRIKLTTLSHKAKLGVSHLERIVYPHQSALQLCIFLFHPLDQVTKLEVSLDFRDKRFRFATKLRPPVIRKIPASTYRASSVGSHHACPRRGLHLVDTFSCRWPVLLTFAPLAPLDQVASPSRRLHCRQPR